ncbi:MAG TPA: caspase family protein [Polyangiaceae bacterium]|jgi:hypothetical protein|nr:caspase family protein [Polyangiaceae bacterium]HNZ21019.1 caspase family protein [Polyangiaceae bacterium]HOD24444.1 caspase family protein [Polyangiaceae bacterium]HOE48819.1 caspase family protein [Polyangiaceae bacterium]HOG98889.1 caspase family protein [Polyangiaceae bacterium]
MSIVAGCGTPKIVKAPPNIEGLRVFVSEPRLTGDAASECAALAPALRSATHSALLKAGFDVVTDMSAPHDAVANVNAEVVSHGLWPLKTYETNAFLSLERDGTIIDQVEGDSGQYRSCTGYEQTVATNLVNSLSASERVARFASSRGTNVAGVAQSDSPTPIVPSEFVAGAPQPSTWALVIGIERYRDVPPPTGARQDAEYFAAMLQRTAGVPEDQLRLILDERATRSDIDKELAWLEKNVPAGARIIVYFSGHGTPDTAKGTPYLLPYDGDPKYVERTSIPLSEVTARLGRASSESMVFLDSCFSGAGGRSVLPSGTRPLVRVTEPSPQAHVAVLSASSVTEVAGQLPGGTSGLFTHFLLEGLGYGRADRDGDGQITLGELEAYVRPLVSKAARRDHRDQTPVLSVEGRLSSAVVVSGVNAK